jgi:hypothetical protein
MVSTSSVQSIACPACGKQQSVTFWTSIDTVQDPKLKEILLEGKLNRKVCSGCLTEFIIETNLLYHDSKQKLMIWLSQSDEPPETPAEEDYTLRTVKWRNQLYEKIHIFDDGLDDRLVEIVKAVVAPEFSAYLEDWAIALLYDGTDDEPEGRMLYLQLLQASGVPRRIALPWEESYGGIKKAFTDKLEAPSGSNRWQIVDQAFAKTIITGAEDANI